MKITFNAGEALSATQLADLGTANHDGRPVVNKGKGFYLYTVTTGGQKLEIVSLKMVAKYGASASFKGAARPPTLELKVPQGADEQHFTDALNTIDAALRAAAVANAAAIGRTAKAINDRWKPIIYHGKDGPTITLKISMEQETPEKDSGDTKKWKVRVIAPNPNGGYTELPAKKLLERNLLVVAHFEVGCIFANDKGVYPHLYLRSVCVLGKATENDDDTFGGSSAIAATRKRSREDAASGSE